ncbi:MAG TPA: helix-turn-helix domain-containing protein [Actinomycetota bacterium]|nr:helix-turn-helix domain-containing protein [Actinomycetota bacterium]
MTFTGTGIGRALRKARLRRGKSLQEASRETRVKAEYLSALEAETFDILLGDVYVRGFLRSYSRYLGLNPDKVVAVYDREYGRSPPEPAPVDLAPGVGVESVVDVPERHRRTAWVLAAAAALIVLISAGAIGLLNRSAPTPEVADPPATAAVAGAPTLPVQVDLEATQGVGAVVLVDGSSEDGFSGPLAPGEAYSFEGQRSIKVHLDSGASVKLRVNGKVLETVGVPGQDYDRIFTPRDFRETGSAG